ncbi:type II toxin-antitoxin system RelE/ParE family toxin [Fulvimarina sp. MAC8]|uniref:type II toxin-antitoxin system RelE/ParE family toxin n=1 Tax=Fulvimarina sp. MAC8 TaxID=3162874 RepID=UPI0032EF7E42
MAEYRLTPRAEKDLRSIWATIATDSERHADRLLTRLLDKFELASDQPRMGVSRPMIAPEVRLLFEDNYIALYKPSDYGIEVIAIVHGMREPGRWLSEE